MSAKGTDKIPPVRSRRSEEMEQWPSDCLTTICLLTSAATVT